MSAWVLPDHVADVLPSEARHIEELRRELLDTARGYGYELVIPPLLEHLESLLTGTGEALDLQTFKLVDQLFPRRKINIDLMIEIRFSTKLIFLP
jgi:ATP phosphoribosyltransferase regulatory subunit